jgi:hypothetical protein
LSVAEVLAMIHGERTGAESKADTLWSVLAAVALFAEQLRLMFGDRHAVQHFVAHRCNHTSSTHARTVLVRLSPVCVDHSIETHKSLDNDSTG